VQGEKFTVQNRELIKRAIHVPYIFIVYYIAKVRRKLIIGMVHCDRCEESLLLGAVFLSVDFIICDVN
jgi:hypothetical protein